jgi:hypothetical protein
MHGYYLAGRDPSVWQARGPDLNLPPVPQTSLFEDDP